MVPTVNRGTRRLSERALASASRLSAGETPKSQPQWSRSRPNIFWLGFGVTSQGKKTGMAAVGDEEILTVLNAVLALSRRLRSERAPSGVTLAGFSILGTLIRLGPVPSNQVAAAEKLEPQSLTRLLADLEKRNLISRARGERDRREIVVAVTAKGRALLKDDLLRRRVWLESAIAATLDERESRGLLAAAAIMLKLAKHQTETGEQ